MCSDAPSVSVAGPADRATVVADLAAAFFDDPVVSWVFPDAAVRRRRGLHFFQMHARRLIPGGLVWRTDGGAALWAAPGRWRESPVDTLRLAIASLPGIRVRRAPRIARGLLDVESRHPHEPHLYLPTIGVRPERQGRGLGARLLRPGLAVADRLGVPAYLESSNPRNVGLYERHGFAVVGEVVLPRGPTMTLMRRPRASSGHRP